MGESSGGNDDEITDINVTPLVDVMLVLLIIFMVTASYIVNQGIDVNLPKAETADDTRSTNLSFVLDQESNLFLDGEAVTFEGLSEQIKKAKAESDQGSLQALISADKATPHGSVVRLIDAIRKNGITDFAINVEAAPPTNEQE